MHDLPRQKLTELLAQYGHGLCDDPKRFEGLLNDVMRNEHKREAFVLINALRQGIVKELSTSGVPLEMLKPKLVGLLCHNLALDEAAAQWSVESWALALGYRGNTPPNPIGGKRKKTARDPKPSPPQSPIIPKPTRPDPEGQQQSEQSPHFVWVLCTLLVAAAVTIGVPYLLAGFFGSRFPWTSTVLGVIFVLMAIAGGFAVREKVGAFVMVGSILFGCLLFRVGRAEIRGNNEKAEQTKQVNEQFELAEKALTQGRYEESLRLADELKPSVRKEDISRLAAIKARAESGTKLYQERVTQADERVLLLVTRARAKLVNLNDVSEESERSVAEAFAVPLATKFAAARDLANELVRRRIWTAQLLLGKKQFDEARIQIQSAKRVAGTSESQLRAALDTLPEATEREPITILLNAILKE